MKNTFPLDQVQDPSWDEIYSLTKREWDVLMQISEDISNQKIADRLFSKVFTTYYFLQTQFLYA